MGLFGIPSKKEMIKLKDENRRKDKKIKQLENLCETKDAYFKEVISDGMRHGSSVAAKYMRDRRDYLNGK